MGDKSNGWSLIIGMLKSRPSVLLDKRYGLVDGVPSRGEVRAEGLLAGWAEEDGSVLSGNVRVEPAAVYLHGLEDRSLRSWECHLRVASKAKLITVGA